MSISKLEKGLKEFLPTECPAPITEYKFMASRNWKFDFAIPSLKIAIEYQGGINMPKSGHSSKFGQTRDWTKFNEAQIRGWIVLCCNPINLKDGSFWEQLERAIKIKRGDIRYE